MRKIIKILTWVMVILIGIILLAGIFTQTPLFRTWLKNFAIDELNDILEGEASIGEINGNLFSNLEIHNLLLTNDNDTLLILPEIHLSYNILALLNDEISVHDFKIINPSLNLIEDSTGIWNVTRMISTNMESDTITFTTEEPFGFMISLNSFSLYGGTVDFGINEPLIPKKVSQLNINLNGHYKSDELRLILDSLSFQTNYPDFNVNKLAFEFSQKEEELHLKNLTVITKSNKFQSNIKHHQSETNQVYLKSEKLDLGEFEFILPDIKLKKNPNLQITSQYNQDSLEFEIGLQSEKEHLTIRGLCENYQALFDSSRNKRIRFNLDFLINNMKPRNWSDHLPEAHVTGNVSLNGSFTGLDDLEANIGGKFQELQISDYFAEVLQINAAFYMGDLAGRVFLHSKITDLDLQINIENIKNCPIYDGTLSINHLNLGELFLSDSIKSDLNFKLHFLGENFIPPNNLFSLKSEWSSSSFNDITIDRLLTVFHMSGTQYTLDTLHIQTPTGIFALAGKGDLSSNHRIRYHFDLGDLQTITNLTEADSLEADGIISGLVSGNLDSLYSNMNFELQNVQYNGFVVDSLAGKTNIFRLDSLLTMDIDVGAEKIEAGDVKIDNLDLSAFYDKNQISSEIKIQFDPNLRSSLSTVLKLDSIIFLSVPNIDFEVIDEHWTGKLDKMSYNTDNNDILISGLNIECTTSEDIRRIFAEGKLSPDGNEDFKLELKGIHPKSILSYLGIDSQIDGRINFNLDLTGAADKPVFKGNLRFEEGNVGSIRYQGINSWFDYADDRFNFDFSLNFNGEDSLIARGHLPLHLSLTDTTDLFDIQRSINLDIKSESIPVWLFLQNLKSFPQVSGNILCDFSLTNTLLDPNIHGQLQLKDGALRSPYWGIDYKDIQLKISALGDKFLLDKFQVISKRRNLNLSGEIQVDFKETDDKIVYSNMNLLADNFYLVQHKDFEIQISSDIKYKMKEGKPRVSGYVNVNRARFYLPTIMRRAGYVTENVNQIKPALVEARERNLRLIDPQKSLDTIQVMRDTLQVPEFLNLLEGDVEIRIARKTWVRNPQLRLELGGNINMSMKKGDFLLKGPVYIVRGQYDLFGRRFTVIQGNIDFQGANDINPPIYLEAEYVYRTVGREKRALVLVVTGNLEYPVITFLESNNPISQDDAISIILYGRKRDELSFGSQSDMAEMDVSAAATGIFSNIVSDRLTKSFNDQLKLDVIEVNATDNWQSANFVVGRYITRDIFVTYKREFGQNLDNNLFPDTISMEYELRKNLFLQMIQGNPQDSGYDLLFKFDWD